MTHSRWRKSIRSAQQTNCVEVAHTNDKIRDSKNEQVLPLTRQAVAGLVHAVRSDKV
jgi:Domain of unknown function (DUF397)